MSVDAPSRAAFPPDATRTTLVASVPASHVYVRHLAALEPDGIVRLPDPEPTSGERSDQQSWWPPAMLDPRWIATEEYDAFHVQFGFDAWTPEELAAAVDAVHERGKPFFFTAHDLRNPHHGTRGLHDAQLDALVPRADRVLTLTPGAAAEIERRWGVQALVLPHPHVVELDDMETYAARPRPDGPFRVGVHVKSLRPSMDPAAILPTLVEAVRDLPDAVLQVNGHHEVLTPGGRRYDAELAEALRDAEGRGDLELHVHEYMADEHLLWEYLWSLDVSVLPYRFGTHSGWLEACRDLGTAVVAPSCGYYHEQGPVHSYVMDEDVFDPASLRAALQAAYRSGAPAPLSVEERRAQRARVAAAHRDLYRQG